MKIASQTWDDLTGLEEIQPSGLEWVRRHLVFAIADARHARLDSLFQILLGPYYDRVQYDPLGPIAHHAIYRLSDAVSIDRRRAIGINPIATLEEWREEWAGNFSKGEDSIPIFSGNAPELPP